MRLSTPILAASLLVTAPAAGGADAVAPRDAWPQFRFDPAHTGFNRFERTISAANVATLVPKWTAIAGSDGLGAGVQSQPTVNDGIVYVNSGDGHVYAFSAVDGSSLWTSNTGGYGSGSATIGGLAYVGTIAGVKAYSLSCVSTCDPTWTGDASTTVNPSPTLSRGVVYVGAYSGNLDALDERTGALVWTGAVNRFDPVFGSPSVADGRVFVPGDKGVYCFPTGCVTPCQPLWIAPLPFGVMESPAVSNGIVYAVDSQGAFVALDAASGARLWGARTGPLPRSPAVDASTVYVSASDGRVWAFPVTCSGTCAPTWTTSVGFGSAPFAPTVANGVVYVGTIDGYYTKGHVLALDAATGAQLWSFETDGAVESSPTVVGGRVYVGTSTGKVYAFGLR